MVEIPCPKCKTSDHGSKNSNICYSSKPNVKILIVIGEVTKLMNIQLGLTNNSIMVITIM